jgi:NAD(P)-dependent dehydrogenase (short-subunit alcohol dehydrogenase family)
MLLDGRVVAITGSGSGVGRAAARLFAAEGAHVVCGDIRPEWNETTVELINADRAGAAVAAMCDVTNEHDVVGLIETASGQFGRLDVMFNNAGIASSKVGLKLDETSNEEYELLLAVNLRGVF